MAVNQIYCPVSFAHKQVEDRYILGKGMAVGEELEVVRCREVAMVVFWAHIYIAL